MSRYKKGKTLALLILVCVFSAPSWCLADNGDGNKLLADCGAALIAFDSQQANIGIDTAFNAGVCVGLMQGILHVNDVYEYQLKGAALFCRPSGTNNGQAVRIVLKYLRDHPEELHKTDSVLAITALQNAFPCTYKK